MNWKDCCGKGSNSEGSEGNRSERDRHLRSEGDRHLRSEGDRHLRSEGDRHLRSQSPCEVVRIEKAQNNCRLCDDYAERQKPKPVAVICCEGACLRGEVARRAANILCHSLAKAETVRICLGGAFTKDTGQRALVRDAKRVIALEGCHVNCASRMMKGVVSGLEAEIVAVDKLYDFDRNLFGIDEMASEEIEAHARTVAEKVAVLVKEGAAEPGKGCC